MALHLAIIVGGPGWYRFFGAGRRIAHMAERGLVLPHLYAVAIAGILMVWAGYALSGAGMIARWPLTVPALAAIGAIYLIRAFALVVPLPLPEGAPAGFWVWSSLICLLLGLLHAGGLWLSLGRLR